ncbi:MAG TPA: hypothetical protein VFE46_05225 [Pirellulales bacterium]|jgi:hypothetical protein|nr:hypothetical protein [Pirellulales bacterium]
MNPREKTLAMCIGGLAVLFALYYVYDTIAGKFNDREMQIARWNKTIDDDQTKIDAGNRAQRKFKQWEKRSLPSDDKIAPSLYEGWLLKLVDDVQLQSATVQPQSTVGHNNSFEKYAFEIKADADISMKEVVDFLYRFYASNQLHKIRQLSIKPHVDGKALDVTINIEALLMPGADRKDRLATEKLDRLALGDAKAYEKVIDDRSLFSEYVPRQQRTEGPRQRTPPAVDVAKFTTVTGVTEQDDQSLVWVLVKTTGQLMQLHEGQEFNVGDVKCKVMKIGVRDAVFAMDGKQVQVHYGDNLRDGTPVQLDDAEPSDKNVE